MYKSFLEEKGLKLWIKLAAKKYRVQGFHKLNKKNGAHKPQSAKI